MRRNIGHVSRRQRDKRGIARGEVQSIADSFSRGVIEGGTDLPGGKAIRCEREVGKGASRAGYIARGLESAWCELERSFHREIKTKSP